MYNISNNYKSALILFIKLVLVFGAFYFISNKIANNEILKNDIFYSFLQTNILNNYLVLITILLFTISNWLLEIRKWKLLVSCIQNISFLQASKEALSSLTASLLTPNRIGEYGAKALYYPAKKRKKIVLLNFLGNFSQMNTTVFFGLIGLVFLGRLIPLELHITLFQILGFSLLIGIFLFYLFKKLWIKYWSQFKINLYAIPISIHIKNYGLSFLRYLIFSHQFYFLLIVFGVHLDYFTLMSLIFIMYLIASVIPGFLIFDWLIKGSVAVSVFGIYEINEIVILSIISIMWILNFALPSVIGSYYILTFNNKHILLKENTLRA
jgi:hypothetical protein